MRNSTLIIIAVLTVSLFILSCVEQGANAAGEAVRYQGGKTGAGGCVPKTKQEFCQNNSFINVKEGDSCGKVSDGCGGYFVCFGNCGNYDKTGLACIESKCAKSDESFEEFTPDIKCIDGDNSPRWDAATWNVAGQDDKFVKSKIKSIFGGDYKAKVVMEDTCLDSILIEYLCLPPEDNALYSQISYDCSDLPDSTGRCLNGACERKSVTESAVTTAKIACTMDTDGGIKPSIKGIVKGGSAQLTDYCKDAKTLVEYSCSRGKSTQSEVDCVAGNYGTTCSNGACATLIG
ncbi:MAG: hypothetical protein AABX05_04225 [Nanoarchaeota archaeon]